MTTAAPLPRLLPLTPQYRERVWGGQQLRPADFTKADSGTPIGEAWTAYGESVVATGPVAGQTLDALLARGPAARSALLGERGPAAGGFPLLIKLLDCADWLSVQVHPDNAQAETMVGPGMLGKTEAWHMLRAAPEAQILAGVKAGTTQEALTRAIRGGTVLQVAERHTVRAGDTVFIPAGTLHALGPGLLLYEVQQSSDTTYRVYDWDRPASAGRALHLEESVAVARADLRGDITPESRTHGEGELTRCDYFVLSGLKLDGGDDVQLDTGGKSFQIVTVTSGQAVLSCGDEQLELGTYQTALVTGAAGAHSLSALGGEAHVLVAALPG